MTILEQLERKGVVAQRLTADSRRVQPGDVFVAFPGAQADGRDFIAQAVARGAVAVIAEAGVPEAQKVGAGGTAIVEVPGLAALSGEIAHLVYGRPSEHLWLAGVTGTNGKTSVSQWIAQALNALRHRCAVIGTLGNGFLDALDESPNTTPDAITLHAALAGFLARGAEACAMEVSSIGLDQGRVHGAAFDVAVFTNLTRDHLEYHGSMATYAAAKERLFFAPGLAAAVVNLDDAFGAELAARLRGRLHLIAYTLDPACVGDDLLRAENLAMGAAGIEFDLRGVHFAAPVVGRFNASNLLAVIGALLARGERLEAIAAVLQGIQPPPGRMQALGGSGEPLVVVDYAHTPDALEKALGVLRETAAARNGKLVCVFGCGGDRDPGKRPQMGAIAERLADRVVLTSDNPRGEDPQVIFNGVLAGMNRRPLIEADRGVAIDEAIADADDRDVILLAGKGHEPYQEIGGVRHAFSDIDAAKSALAGRRSRIPGRQSPTRRGARQS
ncbi:UDP-N-acetylmuramoyl-L-alanyl-D-glutamate--2,6-diaminopimelate ligase [Sulfuritalea hydrogenivorans]|uniref:UDP-N-acetylmuramoyl-L-alanyl-D-glutamate--2,6-diaminopimelate ligase n=1 Tax=Sulfuritalea hydrogenivorans sk43H TaxID=1223802 RepID=W0SJK0_9PROT|nr:UDP-N-acetylmuramoyl-L-alanyl-D-glutamate--2,6-diaminopimelate ligase [Sulfuritalea hydrogenivorans]BAO30856.1 UDP-N-acetylmuramyl tripeptide synthetase [Sulfuritalea hydrogenivorans sk43H]